MNELYHYGIEGMKWGVRRYQNLDGSPTAAGKARDKKEAKREIKSEKLYNKAQRKARYISTSHRAEAKAYKLEMKNKKSEAKLAKKGYKEINKLNKAKNRYDSASKNTELEKAVRKTAEMNAKLILSEINSKKEAYRKSAQAYLNKYGEYDYDKFIRKYASKVN